MAIKKPITKRRPEAEVEDETPKSRLLKKKAAPIEDDDDDDDDAESEPPKKSFKKKAAPVEDDDEPAPKKKGKKSFAALFDDTKPGRTVFPLGDFKMLVTEYELIGEIAEEGEDQGELKAKVTFTGHDDEDEVAGKSISNFYNLCDDDGNAGPGISFLKGDLDVLGYEDVILVDLQEIFDDINAENPEVVVKVKQNAAGYTNAYLQGLAEGE